MVEYRAFMCQDCLKNKSCLYCGCSTPGLFYAPLKKDAKNRWPKIPDQKAWESFKATDPNYQEFKKYL